MQNHGEPILTAIKPNTLLFSVVIPAYNESQNIADTVAQLVPALRNESIPFELIIVNDNSTDDTGNVVGSLIETFPEIRLVHNAPPGGFGRAIRCGLQHVTGDAVAIVMADLSDSPEDVVRYYRKLEEGYDCVFGSRFISGSQVNNYPKGKLIVQRIVNNLIRVMFSTAHNDMTNAFKAYRKYVIDDISPLHAAHFNITIELSLSTLIRQYSIATIPISWEGRTWGQSNLHLRAMGRRYLATLLKIWFERTLVLDDLLQETEAKSNKYR
ncbi:MAG: cell wall biosynthesis glycosyltransferase [Candidatus Hydrogenedentota bacterium]|nr:MAG: cell wall biosynthesis glycosyltransferase [Candidatus Hydrogenedentota bacterium]